MSDANLNCEFEDLNEVVVLSSIVYFFVQQSFKIFIQCHPDKCTKLTIKQNMKICVQI